MRRFVLISLLIGVVFALNVGIYGTRSALSIPPSVRHHRTLLPPRPVPSPPLAPAPPRVEVQATDEDDPPVKVVVASRPSRTRARFTPKPPMSAPTPALALAWRVTGDAEPSNEEAWQSALEKARDVLTVELRLHVPLDPEFIHEKMVRAFNTQQLQLGGTDRPELGKATKIELELELKPEVRDELARTEREYRVQERMAWLARLLAAAVVLLGAVGAYVRFDEWTKGYYTGWLRLALGLTAAAGTAGVWFLA